MNSVVLLVNQALGITTDANPATLPVALQRSLLPMLSLDFFAALKADGDRYIIAFSGGKIKAMDRTETLQEVDVTINGLESPNVVDAEIMDTVNGVRIMVFDIIILNGHSMTKQPYHLRHQATHIFIDLLIRCGLPSEEIKLPIEDCFKQTHIKRVTLTSNVTIEVKPIVEARFVRKLYESRHLFHQEDGIIFTRGRSPYTPFSAPATDLAKWKCRTEVKVDFHLEKSETRLEPRIKEVPEEFLTKQGDLAMYTSHTGMELRPMLFGKMRSNNLFTGPGIYECGFDNDEWYIARKREDKTRQNNIRTVVSTIGGIIDVVTIEDVYEACFA